MPKVKRVLDFAAALIGCIILAPLFLVIALIILAVDGAPVIYTQKRIGKDMKEFTIYKFRTMKNGTRVAATNELTESHERITAFGRILRKTSIDELPQLINILKGDMSFVGPRPLITNEDRIHTLRRDAGVYTVRPGLTGWAQINGRDDVTVEEKVALDKEYVEKQSLIFDFKILLGTVTSVLKMKNVTEGGNK
ncbi:MAG: sugar transferase [Clostridia bacterium]|nr:sugar transferase [Clostridia bacterium]